MYPRCSPLQAVATTGVQPNGMAEGPFILKQTSKTFVQLLLTATKDAGIVGKERAGGD